ncbi:MAG: Ig-like domain-containing protein [Oscillospiraceae bacterium]|nr:Ig-like domain-containing protein [Oscillospiraceae bacterium]
MKKLLSITLSMVLMLSMIVTALPAVSAETTGADTYAVTILNKTEAVISNTSLEVKKGDSYSTTISIKNKEEMGEIKVGVIMDDGTIVEPKAVDDYTLSVDIPKVTGNLYISAYTASKTGAVQVGSSGYGEIVRVLENVVSDMPNVKYYGCEDYYLPNGSFYFEETFTPKEGYEIKEIKAVNTCAYLYDTVNYYGEPLAKGYDYREQDMLDGESADTLTKNEDGSYTLRYMPSGSMFVKVVAEKKATNQDKDGYVKVNYLYACDGDELNFSYKPNYCKYGSSFTTTVKGKETLAYDIISDIGVVMGKDTFIDPIEVDEYTYTIDIPCVTGDITIGALTNSSAHTVHGIGSLCSFTTNLEHVSLYQYIPGDGTTPSYSYPIESQIVNYDYSFYFQIIPDYGYEIVSVTPKRRYLNYDTGEYKISEYSVEKADKNEYLVKAWGEQVLLEGEVRKIQNQAKLSESKLTLKAGDTKILKVTDGTAKAWETSNKNVATVNNGKVTAVGKGTATITATLTTGEKLTCKVTVVTSPKLTLSKVILKSGGSKTIKAVGGTVRSWTTSNKNVATVKDGKITALSKGTATVTATLTTGKKLTCKVVVATAPRLTKTTVKVKKGGTATVLISGKVATIDNKYTNTKIAKINSKVSTSVLKIKGLKKGTTTLKIKVNGVKTLNLKVNVK